ncbi:MAG: hypothetical protein U7126_13090 [Microcoleus sp.]
MTTRVKSPTGGGFGRGYWWGKYRGKQEDEGWYLLTNVGTLRQSIDIFKCQ